MRFHKVAVSGIVLASLAAAGAPVRADDVTFQADTIGATACSQLLQDLKDRPTPTANAVMGWTFGYMVRRNIERGEAKKTQVNFKALGVNQQYVFLIVMRVCEKHPEMKLYEIADGLYEDLLKRDVPTS